MRRILPALLAALFFFPAVGPGAAAAARPFRVGLLTPGPVADGGWNQIAWEGLQRIKKELGARVAHAETTTPAQFVEGFRDFARRGYALVIGHGFEFQDAAREVGKEFSGTVFLTSVGSLGAGNLTSMVFELGEATYLAGVLAGLMSRTGKAGAVGGVKIPPVEVTFRAFEAGFLAVRPKGRVLTSYIGNWEDVGAARQAALALMDHGADVLIHNADAAAAGVFKAARERGAWVIGTNKNQNDQAPKVILASATLDIPGAFVRVAREVKEGRFRPGRKRFDLKSGVIRFVLNPRWKERIGKKRLAALEKARAAIIEGRLKPPGMNF